MAEFITACPTCGEVHEEVAAVTAENVKLARENLGLRNELRQIHRAGPLMDEITDVFDYWKVRCQKQDRVKLDQKRITAIRAMLKAGWTVQQLKRAVDGCALDDWAMGRHPKTNDRPAMNCIGKYICASSEAVENFIGRYERSLKQQGAAVQRVLAGLEGRDLRIGMRPGGWIAQCPAHEDRVSSLTVAQGEDRALIHCQAKCSTEEICAALGYPVAGLFDDWRNNGDAPVPAAAGVATNGQPVERRDPEPLPTADELDAWHRALMNNPTALRALRERRGWTPETLARFGVGTHQGRLIFPVRDSGGSLKTLAKYRLNRTNGESKMLGVAGRPRDLFPAPETLDPALGPVWIVEGEPDALTGHELALPAVGLPGVKFANRAAEWADRFKGREVVVCMDADEEGRTAARKLVGALWPVCAEVRVAELFPERTDGSDLSDLFREAGRERALHVLEDCYLAAEQTERQFEIPEAA